MTTMNISHSIPSEVQSVSFSFLNTEDIHRISVKQIVNPTLLDDLNRPNPGGLYDPALGPSDRNDLYVVYTSLPNPQFASLSEFFIAASLVTRLTIHVPAILVI